MDTTSTEPTAEVLRASMVAAILAAGYARTEPVEHAMRTVARHLFVPDATLDAAYADEAVITKRAADGAALSCASVPAVVAMMLDQLDVRPGHRILEIGAGTGYNAALLAHLAGPTGAVTTLDIDPDITGHARRALDATGNHQVQVITRDGTHGALEHAPYHRIVVTAGAWDLPATWIDQLTPGGRLVVPLRWRGQTHSVAFTTQPDHLRSQSLQLCGFVPMIGQHGEQHAAIDTTGEVTLYWDIDQDITPADLHGVLHRERTEAWSGVSVGTEEPFSGAWLRLTATEPRTCRIAAGPVAVTTGLCTPAIPARSPAIAEGDSLAYFTYRRLTHNNTHTRRVELGAIGHGSTGDDLAARLNHQVRAWGTHRGTPPTITAHSPHTPPDELPAGLAIEKEHTRLIIRYD